MQRHIDDGDEVVFLGCEKDLDACAINIRHRNLICANCISKRKNGLSLLKGNFEYKSFYNIKPEDQKKIDSIRLDFKTVKELQNYSIENFEIGYGVGSTIISNNREPDLIL